MEMPKTLFIVDDDVFQSLPDAVQKKLLKETTRLMSFIPGFIVEARKPAFFPATIHFTDSVVMLVGHDDEVDAAARQINRQEDSNTRFSIKQTGVRIDLERLKQSFGGDPDKGGVGGHGKQVVTEGGGRRVSITMTFGVASLEFAQQAVVDEDLHGQTLADILKKREKRIHDKGQIQYFSSHESLISVRQELEAELMTKHKPLKDWDKGLADNVATALARMVAHEARHQYIPAHSGKGLGADSARIWGDKNYEEFDGSDKANIISKVRQLETDWSSAAVHLELCPREKASPFA
jgi:hypothetical protein